MLPVRRVFCGGTPPYFPPTTLPAPTLLTRIAHYLHRLRDFAGWSEEEYQGEEPLEGSDVVYLQDDYSVSFGVVSQSDTIILPPDDVTPAFRVFCRRVLGFNPQGKYDP